jgi:hypothetical protein
MKAAISCVLDVLGAPLFWVGCLFTNCGKLAWALSDKLQGREVRVH